MPGPIQLLNVRFRLKVAPEAAHVAVSLQGAKPLRACKLYSACNLQLYSWLKFNQTAECANSMTPAAKALTKLR